MARRYIRFRLLHGMTTYDVFQQLQGDSDRNEQLHAAPA